MAAFKLFTTKKRPEPGAPKSGPKTSARSSRSLVDTPTTSQAPQSVPPHSQQNPEREVQRLQVELSEVRRQHEMSEVQQAIRISQTEQEITSLRKKLESIRTSRDEYVRTSQALRERDLVGRREIQTLEAAVGTMENSNRQLQTQLSAMRTREEEIRSLQDMLAQKAEMVNNLETQRTDLERQQGDLRLERNRLQSTVTTQQREIAGLQKDLVDRNEQLEYYQQRLASSLQGAKSPFEPANGGEGGVCQEVASTDTYVTQMMT